MVRVQGRQGRVQPQATSGPMMQRASGAALTLALARRKQPLVQRWVLPLEAALEAGGRRVGDQAGRGR